VPATPTPRSPSRTADTTHRARWPVGSAAISGFLILVGVLVAYWPALSGEFLWDDAGHVTSPQLQSWSRLWRIWFEPGVTQQYYPLLHSAFWLEHRLWGDSTLGYHLINVLWHTMAACLFIAVLRRLAVPGALLGGLLFALHPVCVESVAWISEQKNTLSTVFYLAAALVYLKWHGHPAHGRRGLSRRGSAKAEAPPEHGRDAHGTSKSMRRTPVFLYLAATGLFIAALLTKTVTATLPAALLVVVWWRHGRLSWRGDVRPLLPWFVVGVGAGLFTAWFEKVGIGAQGADFHLSFVERGLLAGRVFWFYLGKLVWPTELIFFYPRWHIDAAAAWQYLFPAAGLALLGALIWWARQGRGRGPLAAFLLFGGTLFPVLGFVDVYPFVFSYVADHFQYLASLSLFALAGAAGAAASASEWFTRLCLPRGSGAVFAALALVVLGTLTWRQSRDYVDSVTLYRATLARNPDSWVAHLNLAEELASRGAPHEALPHARRAVELRPDDPKALNNLADDLTRTGRAAEALPLLDRALQLQPRYAQAHNTRAIALLMLGRAEEGMRHLERAIELQPRLAEAHYNLGLAKAERGDFAGAIPHFAETVRLRPDHADAELNWGVALALSRRLGEARTHFARALELDPHSDSRRQAYARVLLSAGEVEAAVEQLREAVRLNPGLSALHQDLALALHRLGRTAEAEYHAAEARRFHVGGNH
jgi:protein O-mannosyl-transferase